MHLSGVNTQGVVLNIMHFIDECGETSAQTLPSLPPCKYSWETAGSIASNYTFAAQTYVLLLLLLVNFLLVTAALLLELSLRKGFWGFLQVEGTLHSSVLIGIHCQKQNKQRKAEMKLMPHASQKILSMQGAKQPILRARQSYPVQTQ